MKLRISAISFGNILTGVRLAESAERAGCHRVWYTEHPHRDKCVNALMAAVLSGGVTGSIRIGTAGVSLTRVSPAETLLAAYQVSALCPGRFDLGLMRQAGGSHPAAISHLVGHSQATRETYERKLADFRHLALGKPASDGVMPGMFGLPDFESTSVSPPFDTWVCIDSEQTAAIAARLGFFGLFSHHHSMVNHNLTSTEAERRLTVLTNVYRSSWHAINDTEPTLGLMVSGVMAHNDHDTTKERETLKRSNSPMAVGFCGSPGEVAEQLQSLQLSLKIDDIGVSFFNSYDGQLHALMEAVSGLS